MNFGRLFLISIFTGLSSGVTVDYEHDSTVYKLPSFHFISSKTAETRKTYDGSARLDYHLERFLATHEKKDGKSNFHAIAHTHRKINFGPSIVDTNENKNRDRIR